MALLPDRRIGARVGDDVRHRAARQLIGGKISEPFRGEVEDVVQVRRSVDVELPVADPPGSFTRRAVRRDVTGVPAEAPHRVSMQTVEAFVRAREVADAAEIAVYDDAGDRRRVEWPGMPLDAYVSETLRAVSRLEHRPVARRRDDVCLERQRNGAGCGETGVLHVLLCHVACARVERFAVGQRDGRSLGTEIGEAHPTVAVLTEVDDLPFGLDLGDRHSGQHPDAPNRRTDRRTQFRIAVVGGVHRVPCRAVGAGLRPSRHESAQIVDFAGDQVRSQRRGSASIAMSRRFRTPACCPSAESREARQGTQSSSRTRRWRGRCRVARATIRRSGARRVRWRLGRRGWSRRTSAPGSACDTP